MPLYQGTGTSGTTGNWTTSGASYNYNTNYTNATFTITSTSTNIPWIDNTVNGGWYPLGYLTDNEPIGYTQERQEERDRRTRATRERIERERREREAATTRAETLLLSFLSEEQRASYRGDQHFEVVGSVGGRYRIRQGIVGNIDWLDENGRVGGSLCCHPSDEFLPNPDIMLAQMLALITDEESFVLLANRHRGNPHPLRERLVARRRVGV